MEKIFINDILKINDSELSNVRAKFNVYNGYNDPMEVYKEDPDRINTNWFLWKDKKCNFHKGQIAICFLKIAYDTWLMTSIKKITEELDVDPDIGGIGYKGEEINCYKKYFGRLVIKFHNTSRAISRIYETVMDDLEVLEILPDQFTGDGFPGYENVRLSYTQLKTIIERKLPDWTAALQNQKAVYLITDNKTGKLYVGSATSQSDMLLKRWSNYISNGHGGNIELKELVQKYGFDYIKENFQYSILENYNARMDDDYILKRESWWKETLRTREFGYNRN